jgi:hypothetical protein
MPPTLADQPIRGDGKLPIDAVVASCSTRSRVSPKLIWVENPLTDPVACQVGGSLPSHSAGKPVGPTGGDSPHACAVCARTIITATATAALASTIGIVRIVGSLPGPGICTVIEAAAG